LLLLAGVMLVGSFVAASKTPIGRDLSGCQVGTPCDVSSDPSHRENVFFLWVGATLFVFAAGAVLRSMANGFD
jgi:hypothetical protein